MFPDDWSDDLTNAVSTGLRLVVVLVIAAIARWVAHRAISRVTQRMHVSLAGDGLTSTLAGTLSGPASVGRSEARAATIEAMSQSLVTWVLASIVTLLVLGELGINLAPLLAGAGIVGIALGFGAQSLVRDVLAGFFILVEDQFGVGDVIDVGTANGTVERISLRSTQLRDLNGTVWHVPNGTILTVGNKSQRWARAVVEVTIALSADIAAARRIMIEVAETMAQEERWRDAMALDAGPDDQGVSALTPVGATLRIVVTTEPKSQWAVERELRQRIKEAFDAAGISLEVPHIAPPVL